MTDECATQPDDLRAIAVAANEVERRIREQSPVIAAALNKLIASDLLTDDEKRELKHAWKWGVYGSAIHLQCALGDKLRAELNAEHDKGMAKFWGTDAPPPPHEAG